MPVESHLLMDGALHVYRREGIADLETLRTLVASPTLGRTAVHAISELEPRLLEVASQR